MTDFSRPGTRSDPHRRAPDAVTSRRRLAYSGDNHFRHALRTRVDAHFRESGNSRRDVATWYLKAATILVTSGLSYTLLVFAASTWWQALPLTVLLALSVAGIGFNIMHDGGHRAVSRHHLVNRLMALSLDIVGGSSYLWHWKHGVLHHNYVNITGHDMDIALGRLARFTPHQPHYPHQRWQHWYIWILYGLLAVKWQFYDDFKVLLTGKIGPHRIPRPRGVDLLMLILGKLCFAVLAFAIPLTQHSFWAVIPFYLLFAFVLGFVLSVVFQLAHTVGEASYPDIPEGTHSVDNSWAAHQVETTVNFCHGNRVVTWLLGGLNYQIEHHLFPEISHCNYPALSQIVKRACAEFGIVYKEHASFRDGLRSHVTWLRRLGNIEAAA
jgi:linoleoyl-CoA desaturase